MIRHLQSAVRHRLVAVMLAALSLVFSYVPGHSQATVTICVQPTGPGPRCDPVTSSAPLPVTGTFTSDTTTLAPITPATATATQSVVLGAQYNSTQATFTNTQQGSLQISSRGELKIVNMDAAGNARGANVNASNQMSVSLDGGAGATVAATQSGAWTVAATQSGAWTVAATQSGTWTVQPGNVANSTAWLVTGTGGTFPATQSGTWTVQPGNTANTTPWLVSTSQGGNTVVVATAGADGASNTANGETSYDRVNIFNGTTWDRSRSIILGTNSTGTGIAAVGLTAQLDDTAPTAITENSFGNLRISSERGLYTTPLPSTTAAAGIAPSATQSAASNSVLKSGAGNLYSITITIGATSGWLMIFDATALPGNGATGSSLKYCVPVTSDGTSGGYTLSWPIPVVYATGITAGFSSTACNSITASATAFFYAQVL